MARRTRLFISISLFSFVILGCAASSLAQPPGAYPGWNNPHHFDAGRLGSRVQLGPDWLFSGDDNPAYASPAYDDSGWKIVSSGRPLDSNDIPSSGHAWYRMHAHVSPKERCLALEIQHFEGGCEIFVNGSRIGQIGSMDSGHQEQGYLTSYEIPDSMIAPRGDLVIAIRVALNRTGRGGIGTITPFQAGSVVLSSREEVQRDASYEAAHQTVIELMLSGLSLVVGLVALALYLAMRNRAEYLAIAISMLGNSFQLGEIVWYRLNGFNPRVEFLETLWLGIANVALIEFVRLILHLRFLRWLLAIEIAIFLGFFTPNLAELGVPLGISTFMAYFLPSLIAFAVLPVLLLQGLLRGNRDARVVLPAITVVSVANYWNCLSIAGGLLHWRLRVPPLPDFQIGSYTTDFWNVWNAIYFVTMLLFLVIRTISIARERARAAAELEAARVVQQVLIPEDIPAVPGFALESSYKPAGEVGGDFFQIVPVKSGGVLVVIGDVSGKGMPAAMTVSLLVGTFRTLAHYTQSPTEILAAMNTRMLARSHGGFTTCLVLRADPDGMLTVANAGHISPYLAGKELPLENGLPLGLSAATSYRESTFQLALGQQITLVTDGVVEARDKSGVLFGFERTAALSMQSADQIARTAELFGQDDDITALTLIATATPVLA